MDDIIVRSGTKSVRHLLSRVVVSPDWSRTYNPKTREFTNNPTELTLTQCGQVLVGARLEVKTDRRGVSCGDCRSIERAVRNSVDVTEDAVDNVRRVA